MRYEGSFGLTKNGSSTTAKKREEPLEDSEYSRAEERDYRRYNATVEDVIALVNGAGYTVRFGKQTLGYFSNQRQAVFEAGRQGAKAYKIVREGKPNSSTLVVLIPVEDSGSNSQSAAELIADKIRDQIEAGDAPLSPLAKQRVVMMLFSFCKEKDMSEECFQILYPMATKEQFDRLWRGISEKEIAPQITTKENFFQYADSRGFINIAQAIVKNDLNACLISCSAASISEAQFEDLCKSAVNNSISTNSSLLNATRRHIARESVERRLEGDIFRMLKNDENLRRMAVSGNTEGICDYLTSNGYSAREAKEASDEIVSLGTLANKM
jgi:hypothetical protein